MEKMKFNDFADKYINVHRHQKYIFENKRLNHVINGHIYLEEW